MTSWLIAWSVASVWIVASVWWFVKHLGDKHGGRDPWYIWVLMLPLLVLALLVGLCLRLDRTLAEIARQPRDKKDET